MCACPFAVSRPMPWTCLRPYACHGAIVVSFVARVFLSEGEQQRRGSKRHTEHDPLHSRGGGDGAHARMQSRRCDPCTEDRMGTRCSHNASLVQPGGEPRRATPPCVRPICSRAALCGVSI